MKLIDFELCEWESTATAFCLNLRGSLNKLLPWIVFQTKIRISNSENLQLFHHFVEATIQPRIYYGLLY